MRKTVCVWLCGYDATFVQLLGDMRADRQTISSQYLARTPPGDECITERVHCLC